MPHPADPTRAALLRAILPFVPDRGWSDRALREAARAVDVTEAEACAACPRGALDLAVEWHREGDRAMVAALRGADLGTMRMRDRIAFALKARLAAMDGVGMDGGGMDGAGALSRSAALFALPANARAGGRLLWETADAAWTALGDRSRDGNWYTKRATLAAVQAAVTLYRLSDDSPGATATQAFVDRRIGEVMALEGWKARAGGNPLLRPLTAPLGWLMGRIQAPARTPDLAEPWSGESPDAGGRP